MCLDHVSRRRFLQFSAVSATMLATGGVKSAEPEAIALQSPRAAPRSELTDGMIDFHVHTYPDNFDRTVSGVEAAQTARDRGLRAIVLKGGAFETMTRAAQARAAVMASRCSAVWSSTGPWVGSTRPRCRPWSSSGAAARRSSAASSGCPARIRATITRCSTSRPRRSRSSTAPTCCRRCARCWGSVPSTTWCWRPATLRPRRRWRSSARRARPASRKSSAPMPTTTRSTCRSTSSSRRRGWARSSSTRTSASSLGLTRRPSASAPGAARPSSRWRPRSRRSAREAASCRATWAPPRSASRRTATPPSYRGSSSWA